MLFADDTLLLYSYKNIKFLKYALEHNMKRLNNQYRANKLSLSVTKTVLLKFWPEKKCFDIDVQGMKIVNAHQTKFLGVLVDDCLSWKSQVNHLAKLQ